MEHRLKTDHKPFQEMWDGHKTFEFRKNDRNYRPGDELVLIESVSEPRRMSATVGFVLYSGSYGMPDGVCCMSLVNVEKHLPLEFAAPSADHSNDFDGSDGGPLPTDPELAADTLEALKEDAACGREQDRREREGGT